MHDSRDVQSPHVLDNFSPKITTIEISSARSARVSHPRSTARLTLAKMNNYLTSGFALDPIHTAIYSSLTTFAASKID